MAHAENNTPERPGHGHGDQGSDSCEMKQSHCKQAKLDENQTAQIKAAKEQYKTQMKSTQTQLKAAYKKFTDLMKDPNANMSSAQAATQEINTLRNQMMKAKQDLTLNILFNIAKPEQRMHLFHCMMEKEHRGHGYHHGDHGDGNDTGDNDTGSDDDSGSHPGDHQRQPAPAPSPRP